MAVSGGFGAEKQEIMRSNVQLSVFPAICQHHSNFFCCALLRWNSSSGSWPQSWLKVFNVHMQSVVGHMYVLVTGSIYRNTHRPEPAASDEDFIHIRSDTELYVPHGGIHLTFGHPF